MTKRPAGKSQRRRAQTTAASPLVAKLRARLAEARKQIADLKQRADTDVLLDIPNRRSFERELRRSLAYVKRYRATAALLYLDVDRLKPINDRYGHAAGDAALKAIVRELIDSRPHVGPRRAAWRRRVRHPAVEPEARRCREESAGAREPRSISCA